MTKFLGLILDDRFSYSDHVSQLVKQLSKIKGVLLKLSHVVPSFVIRKIYYALFYSRISYNITVWGNGNVTGVDRVRKINKSVMDIFLKVPNSIPRSFLYNDLYNFACLKTLHKYNYNEFFTYFNEKFLSLAPIHDHGTRFVSNIGYTLPPLFKSVSHRQFLFTTIKLWNSLPVYLKEMEDSNLFRTSLKS